ncbi:polyphosphate--glucose phosphotransferase [Nocardiopsis chromatogenes]|uniref:polyphosphate--glucose phosphotransferase n=1 Tax=Nocardiopsis chromatogenes TaxID=280239 RepID=UPI00034B38B7|nr:ROK family protein [Nocardiopsis chromatogenes]
MADQAADTHVGVGVDIGGSGIKGAPVDLGTGAFTADRVKIRTPQPSTPEAVSRVVAQIASSVGGGAPSGAPLGVTFPGVVRNGTAETAANVDDAWIGQNVEGLLSEATGRAVAAVNDADAAAVAEHRWGAARGVRGTVLLTTLGTGIGTALLVDGHLVPNTEFGHLVVDGHDAETRASSAAKEREELSYEEWATERLQRYYEEVERLLSPDLIVIGGGVSRKADKFLGYLKLKADVAPADLRNAAGIAGAALIAAERFA